MVIDLNVLGRQNALYGNEYEEAALRVLRSGQYILGLEVESFEREFAEYIGSKYCVGVASGLDALRLSIKALGIGDGDEVIVPANTYIATVLAITDNKAIPVFVEPDNYYCIDTERIEKAISSKTKAIIAVHLYGQSSKMDKIMEFTKKYNIFLLEDCAQSHGAHFKNRMTGSFGIAGCFSFYPTKNLGAFGDAGAIVTDNADLAQKLCMIRNYGSKIKYHNELEGMNSRLDEIQAAMLRVKLKYLDNLIKERQNIAERYLINIHNSIINLPETREDSEHVYHQFVIRTKVRDKLMEYLRKKGISTIIHYPIPPHLAECYARLGYQKGDFPLTEQYAEEVLSLPIFNGMTTDEINYIIEMCNTFST